MRVVAVCSGNICRSPIVEQVLRARLDDFGPARGRLEFVSAGTIADPGQAMPEPAAEWSLRLGADPERGIDPARHGATFLTEQVLRDATLVLGLERAHRSAVVGLAPALLRRTFTLREVERLAGHLSDAELAAAVDGPFVEPTPAGRLGAVIAALADLRGMEAGESAPEDDDVVDPYRGDAARYALAAEQMRPGLDAVARLLTLPVVWQD